MREPENKTIEHSYTYDLSASGGPASITAEELTQLAAEAKAKVKAKRMGWSMLSHLEVLALAWFADLFLEDGQLPDPAPPQPEPTVISQL